MKVIGPIILAHGGVGLRAMTSPQVASLCAAIEVGYHLLDRGVSALIAVEQTVRALKRSGLLNAGKGAHLQLDGVWRMVASVMEERNLQEGAVASIQGIVHPITAARLVIEQTNHVLVVGASATTFGRHFNLNRQPQHSHRHLARRISLTHACSSEILRLYRDMIKSRFILRVRPGKGTVGAVALDQSDTVAAGASTGGIDVMLPGRVGDMPIIGCGVYADNQSAAVARTGEGEGIIRLAVAKEICDRLARTTNPEAVTRLVYRKLVTRIQAAAGALVVTPDGRFTISHETPRMAAGW